MSNHHTHKVLPYAANYIISTKPSQDKDRILTNAWEVRHVNEINDAKRHCELSKAKLWTTMYYNSSAISNKNEMVLMTTYREQQKLLHDKCRLNNIEREAMKAWLLIDTNRDALKKLEIEIADNKKVRLFKLYWFYSLYVISLIS